MPDPIVLFGGTFDPVHHGHLIIARAAAEAKGYRRITLLPAASPPHKAAAEATPADRVAMLRRATAGDPLFEIDEIELQRPGPSYTIDTLAALRDRRGPQARLILLIGADMLAELPAWRRAREVVRLAELVVAARAGWQQRMDQVFRDLQDHFPQEAVDRIRRSAVATPLIDISSTDIRCRIAAGRPVRYLLPDAVREYIERCGLYRPGGRGPDAAAATR